MDLPHVPDSVLVGTGDTSYNYCGQQTRGFARILPMATGRQDELSNFHDFLSQRLRSSGARLSPEEVLDLWRAEHPAADDNPNDVAALKEALAEMEAGDHGLPLEHFDRKFRQRHSIPPGA
jgi:uncharacterized protein with von Willebrand factor type A (vWA) domain